MRHAEGTDQVKRLLILLLLAVVPMQTFAQPAATPERRVAFVIGIGAYQNAPRLANPVNDAKAIGEALRRLNFQVDEVYDADFRQLSRALREFGIKAQQSDVAVIYYAGHGVQVGRENYLLPADAVLQRERDLVYEALSLDLFLGEIAQAQKLGIILLDACRNNPFVDRLTRSVTVSSRGPASAGLARVDNVPRNTLVAMATKADQTAEDGGGSHSPFAEALLKNLQIPGLELSLFFRSVRDSVLQVTNNQQEPFIFSSLGADPFYFNPRPPNQPPQIGVIPPLEVRDNAGPTPLPIPKPTDPDGDPLTVRITGLPRSGEVRIEGRLVTPGAVYGVDRFATATYKPTGSALGDVGTLDILVEDGRGGSVLGSLPISVVTSNHPPVTEARRRLRIYTGALGITPPTDPDGDKLTVTVQGLPRGLVRFGVNTLRTGDRLEPQQLPALVYVPEPGFSGPAGTFQYLVDDGRGGRAEGDLDIDVMDPAEAAAQMAEAALWERLRASGRVEDVETFLRLYPNSYLAATAQRRREELLAQNAPKAAPPAAAPQPPTPLQSVAKPVSPPPAPPPVVVAATPKAPDKVAALQPIVPPAEPPPPPRRDLAMVVPPVAVPPIADGDHGFQDCPTCVHMVRIPGGTLMMGQGSKDPTAVPVHKVVLRSFALSEYPVTVAEWNACHADGVCGPPPRMAATQGETPIHNVSWDDAQLFVTWISRRAGHAYRLPTEAEWEYAARADTATRYWWGDHPGTALANCAGCGGTQDPRAPLPVNAFQPNPFGLYGMLGGVAQWVQDCWFPSYNNAPIDGSAHQAPNCVKRVLRGGSFRSNLDEIMPTARGNYDGPVRYLENGFRVARNLD
ncbi:MAG TPA: SUMF1/EgtB/PvdO family nonheme iron enzyme [Acetobacteraceae bacterium]|nr:SUMF1/EgtB/PvdO family nonheme iron enzyme [Acetobacteraceae bacterium]